MSVVALWVALCLIIIMHEDSPFVQADHDDGTTRLCFWIRHCPSHDDCSKASWKRAKCSSYHSQEKAKEMLKQHLMLSGHHQFDEDRASLVADSAEVEIHEESKEEREEYRRSSVSFAPAPPSHPPPAPIGSRPSTDQSHHRRHSRSRSRRRRDYSRSRSTAAIGIMPKGAASSSSAAPRPRDRPQPQNEVAVVPRSPSSVNEQRFAMVMDSINRTQTSIGQCQRVLTQTAGLFQERAGAMMATAGQLQEESAVMAAAKEFMLEWKHQMDRGN